MIILLAIALLSSTSASNFVSWPYNKPPPGRRNTAYYKTAMSGPRHVFQTTKSERPHSPQKYRPVIPDSIEFRDLSDTGEEKVDEDVPARFVFNLPLNAATRSVPNPEFPPITSKTLTFAIAESLVHFEDLNILKSIVDFSEEAVLERLLIYLNKDSAKAVLYELIGNPQAATMTLFQKLLPTMVEHAKFLNAFNSHDMAYSKTMTASRHTLLNIIQAFLLHNVPIFRAAEFIKAFPVFKSVFSLLDKPFIAFFVLTADIEEFQAHEGAWDVNLLGVSQALLMLPKSIQVPVARELFEQIKPARSNIQLLKKVFKETNNQELIELLVHECYFNPMTHEDCLRQARYELFHPRWNSFRPELISFGYDLVQSHKPPTPTPKSKLPFLLYIASEKELNVYMEAYGELFIRKFFELVLKKEA